QIGTAETGRRGNVRHVEVFQMGSVRTSILGRPRLPPLTDAPTNPQPGLHPRLGRAGLILLAIGQQGADLVNVPESFAKLPDALISIVLASLVIGVRIDRSKIRSYLDYSFITMTAYGMQMGLGVLLGALLARFWPGLPDGWGVMGVFAFHGGHGTAAAAGAEFERLGIGANMAVGMVLSTLGLIIAMAAGMVLVNYGIRKGWGTYVKKPAGQPDYFYGGVLPEDVRAPAGMTVVTANSINHLALQFGWLLLALLIGQKIFGFLGNYISFFATLPGVLHGIFGGAILWFILVKTKLDRYVDLKTIKMISGFLLEIVIFSAMATLDLEFVSVYIVPMLIYVAVLCSLSMLIILVLSRKCLAHEWFEKACMAIGAATGNTSTGLALVRALDPDSRSSAGDTHGIYSTVMSWKDVFVGLAPVWLSAGLTLSVGVGFIIMIAACVCAFIFAETR
ncbi:hypothetical protein, partial [Propionibacterium australiense]|uniref:hypothetical protein n=1 Tax=Propionibacterium australiense TaxID=119981 RepID=UPI001C7DDDCB